MIELLLGGRPGLGGALEFTTSTSLIALAITAAVLAWILAWSSSSHHRAHRRLRLLEGAAWALALGALAFGLSGPTWVEEAGRTESGRLVVLIDESASMSVLDGKAPRSEAVAPLLERITRAAGDGQVDLYSFDEELFPGPPASFSGRDSQLGVALAGVSDRYLGQQLRGIVLLTDGVDRGPLRRAWRAAAQEGQGWSGPELAGPLTIYQLGAPEELQDLAVEDVQSGGFAFLRTPFHLVAHIRGAANALVPVTLSREGRLVSQRSVTLDAEGRGEIDFPVTPTRVGRFAWEVSVPEVEGDAIPGNNRFPVVVRVVRDRTRVLQVSGSPSLDQKFLRLFLKEDPSVDLVSFFILRTREDMSAPWTSDELSLIAFPYADLFSKDLDSFDLVIFQNFNYLPYFDFGSSELLGNIAEYVKDGHALVMTGGDRSFDLGEYGTTPLAEILPVKLLVPGEKVDLVPFQPVASSAGLVHPITQLGPTQAESAQMWADLPDLDGMNLSRGLADGAAMLLGHPTLRDPDGQPMPVLAVREVGQGRTMALAVDASWRWSFTEAGAGRGNQAYLRFWKNAMRWLVADPEDRRVVVTPSSENVLLGDPVTLLVKVRDTAYGPVQGARAKGEIELPDGSRQGFDLMTDVAGEARTTVDATIQGAHRVKVRVPGSGDQVAETVFAVSARDPELAEITPDGAFLNALAASYGERGQRVGPGEWEPPLLDEGASRQVGERHELPLGATPLLAFVVGLFASLGWWARRKGGAR